MTRIDAVTELTQLTLAEARDGLKAKDFSATELTKAHLDAIEKARALNAYVLRDAGEGARHGQGLRRAARAGRGAAARRHSARHQGPVLHRGRAHHGLRHILDGFKPPYESTVTANLWGDGAVMLGKLNMDEFAMGSSNETSAYGPVRQSVAARGLATRRSVPGRLVGRLGGGGRGASLRSAPPPPTPAARSASRRPSPARSASSRPTAAARAGASSPSPPRSTRPGRSPATCATRDPAAVHGRRRPEGHDLASTSPVPDYEAADRRRRQGPEGRHSEGIPRSTACRDEIEALWQQGIAWLQGCRRRDRRHLAAAHQIRAAGLLHRGAGRGLVQPRPL